MPAHHSGFRRYMKPSPSKPCLSPACIKPYVAVARSARSIPFGSGNSVGGSMGASRKLPCVRIRSVQGHESYLLRDDKTCACADDEESVNRGYVAKIIADLGSRTNVPIAKLDDMASARPMYLQIQTSSASPSPANIFPIDLPPSTGGCATRTSPRASSCHGARENRNAPKRSRPLCWVSWWSAVAATVSKE